MTPREAVIATLKREPSEFVPGNVFFSTAQAEKILLPGPCSKAEEDLDGYKMEFARATGSCIIDVSGNLRGRLVEKTENSMIIELDNGTRRLIVMEPEYFYDTLSRPMDGHYDLTKMNLPDPDTYQDYWDGVAESVKKFKEAGFWVNGTLDGFYAGLWEHVRRIEDVLVDIAEDTPFAKELVDMWGTFKCKCANKLLECDVDGIWWTDDLGSNTGPIMSPKAYKKFFWPWHKRAAEIANEYGKVAMMHSHGNINMLLPDMVETGIDVLNPIGPSDGMDLKHVKETYGDRLCLCGGISKFLADMSVNQIREHLDEVYRVGSKDSGFIAA